MQFRTEITPSKAPFQLSHRDTILMLGSCFSENIGAHLQRFRFDTTINSHGIVFNPLSAAIALNDVVSKKQYTSDELIHLHNRFASLAHHGKFSKENAEETLDEINNKIALSHSKLDNAKVLFVTFGSAWAYRHIKSNLIVANCHKIPQNQFEKQLLTHDEIIREWTLLLSKITVLYPQMQVVFTVSPVRYWRDGYEQNQLSKSHLLIACHALKEAFSSAHYFPSYELMMDDLRDYRFFKEDMLHPNEQAIQYVWEKLTQWCMTSHTQETLQRLEPLLRFVSHHPLNISIQEFEALKEQKEKQIYAIISEVK